MICVIDKSWIFRSKKQAKWIVSRVSARQAQAQGYSFTKIFYILFLSLYSLWYSVADRTEAEVTLKRVNCFNHTLSIFHLFVQVCVYTYWKLIMFVRCSWALQWRVISQLPCLSMPVWFCAKVYRSRKGSCFFGELGWVDQARGWRLMLRFGADSRESDKQTNDSTLKTVSTVQLFQS